MAIAGRTLVGRATVLAVVLAAAVPVVGADEELEAIDSRACAGCHETDTHGADPAAVLSRSVHDALECLDCHRDRGTIPHVSQDGFAAGCQGCRSCHEEESAKYQAHGRKMVGACDDIPRCSDCHGDHGILPSTDKRSPVHPTQLPQTCGKCHEDLDITSKYEILIDHPVEIYEASVHGQATRGGVYVAATCNDCHSTGGSAHRILAPSFPESSIAFFNIPATCGKCHRGVEQDYWEGIHGQMVRNGETDAPVCTSCHGEHGILSPRNPLSPVSPTHVAERTCARCHDSEVLNEKYGLATRRLVSFVDSYHGLKSKAGDTRVANCASCHGPHRILPSTDPGSTIHPANLRRTCGECHPKISAQLAETPIHGVGGRGLHTRASEVVAAVYKVAIAVIIGLMVIHWLIDLVRKIRAVIDSRPQLRRMRGDEVVQHALLALSFIVLVISGFALRYDQSWFARQFFGWEGGFALRGLIHRIAALVFIATVGWHAVYLSTARGRRFLADMWPGTDDFVSFWQRILHNLGLRDERPRAGRFSYVEKAEYWALVWGAAVMVITGVMLWFDNWFVTFVPRGVLDVALTIHFWEAWLATLAIAVWHLYSTVFDPNVYPMNPSWLTGTMPEAMYEEEHPGHLDEARKETEEWLRRAAERVHGPSPGDRE